MRKTETPVLLRYAEKLQRSLVGRLGATGLALFVAVSLGGCGITWLTSTGLSTELVGQSRAEFEQGWQAEAHRVVGNGAKPSRVVKEMLGNVQYELLFWSVGNRYGTWSHDEWVAFRNGVVVQVGSGGVNASSVEQRWLSIKNFGTVPLDQLDAIKAAAEQQSEMDPMCGLVRGPGYGDKGLVAIVHTPSTSPWKYQAVVVEYGNPRVIGEIDFYLLPVGDGRYDGIMRWWNSRGYSYEVNKCEVAIRAPSSAVLTSSFSGVPQSLPLRLISQETRAQRIATAPSNSSGTGWIEEHGLVVTNEHVISKAKSLKIVFGDGREATAVVLASDIVNDLALLKVDLATLPAGIRVRDATAVLGEDVLTLGYPLTWLLGDSLKMGRGSVSGTSGLEGNATLLQIDAPVHPGNSGGPVLAMDGQVIGVISARVRDIVVLRESGVIPQNINYAIKAAYLRPLLSMVPHLGSHPVASIEASASAENVVRAVQQAVVRIEVTR